jgi:hypothetical protein
MTPQEFEHLLDLMEPEPPEDDEMTAARAIGIWLCISGCAWLALAGGVWAWAKGVF